ncbi:MAG: ferredoxin reductase family protein [Rhodospirillales bacterium]
MSINPLDRAEAPESPSFVRRLQGRLTAVSPGWWLVLSALTVTTVLWFMGRAAMPAGAPFFPWLGPSLLISAWSITLLTLLLLANTRSRKIEPFFGGLDRAVRLHRQLGPLAVGLILIHVALYIPPELGIEGSVADLLIPFHSPQGGEAFNALILWLVLAWTVLAYTKRLRYERWLSLHGLFGPIFILTSVHALMAGPTINAFEPLRFWMWLLVLVGSGAWLYRVVLYRWVAPRFHYSVLRVDRTSENTVDLVMRPKSRRMIYEPGTFVFINRPNIDRRELHPFSISSSPAERDLRVSVRMVGDFTRELPNLNPGDPIEVFGPFGGFTPHRYPDYRRLICVGSGIGITPFLGMLRFEATNDDFRRIWLYYVVRDAEHAPYDAEIREVVPIADSYIDYELWQTADRGRPSAEALLEATRPLEGVAVMLCGRPEFVRDMVRQFTEAGIPRERIIAEDFHFH